MIKFISNSSLSILLFATMLLFAQCKESTEGEIPTLSVKPNNLSFIQQGESKTVEVSANNAWKVIIPESDKGWLSASQSISELNIIATENPALDLRQSKIVITSENLKEEITISQFGREPEIIPSTNLVELESFRSTFEVVISSNVEYELTITNGSGWLSQAPKSILKSGLTDATYSFIASKNPDASSRTANIKMMQKNGNKVTNISVSQKGVESFNAKDIKVAVKNAWTNSEYPSDKITNSIDGDKGTIWHSDWRSETKWPIYAVYFFDKADFIDYLVYTPRSGHTNGNFKELKLYVSYEENPDQSNQSHWTYINEYNFQGSSTPSEIAFSPTLKSPTAIKFEILSGVGDNQSGFAACAEMEFFQKQIHNYDLTKYFADEICTELNPGITEKDILEAEIPHFFKDLALELLSGDYSPYRIAEYEPYRPVGDLAKEFKTSSYNQFENPTGIWLKKDRDVYVFVPDTRGEKISLINHNWTQKTHEVFALKKGINQLTPSFDGQTYISYFTPNYERAEPIKIHIAGGSINGYFDRENNTAEEWKDILKNAVGDHLDIVGKYTNLIFHIPSLRKHCPVEGMKLIEVYDEIIEIQYEQMGLFKYNRIPKNRMLGRNMPDGFMHADGYGAAFQNETMGTIGSFNKIVEGGNSWGIAHEYGHVNQIRPGLKWIGTTECTNNIYSSYTQYILTSKYSKLALRLEHENCRDIKAEEGGTNVIGGRFNSYLHYGVLKEGNWMFQWGQDGGGDHFVKLAPMWQLNLYYKVVKNASWSKPDWFGDICEETRITNDAGFSNGDHQINFMKRACKYTETDLTEFFEKAGLLRPIDETIDDYGKGRITITDAMCDEVRAYVKRNGWKKPEGLINYISANTIAAYEGKLALEGQLNQGVSGSGNSRTINHNTWKNAVVYETYKGDKPIRITMAGTGTTNNMSTLVPYPTGATKIVAVSWNGERKPVYEP